MLFVVQDDIAKHAVSSSGTRREAGGTVGLVQLLPMFRDDTGTFRGRIPGFHFLIEA
ncbi:MAG: hypothetical protein U1E76_08060 [Planctomycetota bacterium]